MPEEDATEILKDHFRNPRNVGSLAGADGCGTASTGSCGDVICIWIRVADRRIVDVSFKCKGCAAAIACGSITTQLARAKTLDEAGMIDGERIAAAVGGLPENRQHCSQIAAEALANAIADYRSHRAEEPPSPRR
ncbi:MAG: iron-sulfur cluster assembly scaffold protein [Planctomycetota bacterium]|jgi:nitrogen fixation NifU-like protein